MKEIIDICIGMPLTFQSGRVIMFTVCRTSALVLGFVLSASSQQTKPNLPTPTIPGPLQSLQQTTPPDTILYHALFMRYYSQEQFAAHIDAEGKKGPKGQPITGTTVRTLLMKQIGLSAAEDASVKTIALDYVSGFQTFMQQRGQLLVNIKNIAPANAVSVATTATTSSISTLAAQITTLEQQHQTSAANHIAQIQSAMTPARFQVLDSFVRTSIASHVKYQSGTIQVKK